MSKKQLNVDLDAVIVFKSIAQLPVSKFKSLLNKAEKATKSASLKKSDINTAISQVRKDKKSQSKKEKEADEERRFLLKQEKKRRNNEGIN